MTIQPSTPRAPKYPALAALAMAGAATLALSSCRCPACEGSGLQLRTATGLVPCPNAAEADIKTMSVCASCNGTGHSGRRGQLMSGVCLPTISADEIRKMTR